VDQNLRAGAEPSWRGRNIHLTAEEHEEQGHTMTFHVQLDRKQITMAGRSDWMEVELEDVLASRFLRVGVRLNTQGPITEDWQGTTQMATIRTRGGRREEEKEPDGAPWETEADARELTARLSEEIGELDELNRMQLALIPRIERYLAGANQIREEIANDAERVQRIQSENQHLVQALAEIQEGRNRDHVKLMRLLDHRRREEHGLTQLGDA
jgi:hypothetical protein